MAKTGQQSVPSSQQSDVSNDFVQGRLLDGFLLLAAGGSSSPDEVVSVNLSSLQLVDVAAEDLSFFVHLDRLDASDNQLSDEQILHQMGRLPRLTTLSLACNSISALQVQVGTLRQLQNLDLSFNALHGDVLSHLSRLSGLVTLNLSRNCISSVPPEEELYGLQVLEELILDSNDLVQFIQWRALDALPRLRKLSLASNRVKRLKDDAPDTASGDAELNYFPQLEELNLSCNEIADVDQLPVVSVFRSLRTLVLNDNPCTQEQRKEAQGLHGLSIECQDTKPFYLKGSGCHQLREKRTEPRLKLQHRRMRRVRSSPQVRRGSVGQQVRNRDASQLGIWDAGANQLRVALPDDAGQEDASGFFLTAPTSATTPSQTPGIFSDELTVEELDRIFQERRANIDQRFRAEAEEPASFMRPLPFQISAAAGRKRLGLQSQQEEDETGVLTSPTNKRPSSSTAFLTGLSEVADSANVGTSAAGTLAGTLAGTSTPTVAGYGAPSRQGSRSKLVLVGGGPGSIGHAPLQPGEATLPPIHGPGSRGSSVAAGGLSSRSLGEPTLPLLQGPKSKSMPDVSVRDAMRALRAAAMSDYALAR